MYWAVSVAPKTATLLSLKFALRFFVFRRQGDADVNGDGIAVTARGLFDYRSMFLLDDNAINSTSFLDCAAGASSFGAQVRARNGRALSVDPIYDQPAEQIVARVRNNLANSGKWFAANDAAIDWNYLGTHLAYCRATDAILDLFADDYRRSPSQYLAGRLPNLPLADDAVDMCLTSNFLFAYSELMSAREHIESLLELTRVARSEVRAHPVDHRGGSDISLLVEEVCEGLTAAGCTVKLVAPEHSWLKGARTMIVSK